MRSPRFEPGSSAWQADVLDHCSQDSTRIYKIPNESRKLDYDRTPETTLQERLKPIPPEISGRIANTLIKLENNARAHTTIKTNEYDLRHLAQHADLLDPESVKAYVANAKTKAGKPVTPETKNKWLFCYDNFCKYNNIKWEKPYYKVEETTPLIPTPQNVQAIIDNASKQYVTIFTIEAETGCSPMELHKITQADIDQEQGVIRIKGTKGHASGTYKLKPQTAEMLRAYLHNHTEASPFPSPHSQSQVWLDTKERASKKLHKPELSKIQLRNLRNFSGSQYYKALPIRDPIAVMRHLRHKKLETTMHYIRAIVLDYEEDEQWISRTSTTIEEDAKLIESGFQYVTERDGTKLFRKRK